MLQALIVDKMLDLCEGQLFVTVAIIPMPISSAAEFFFSAAICAMLDDWSGMDLGRAVQFIFQCQVPVSFAETEGVLDIRVAASLSLVHGALIARFRVQSITSCCLKQGLCAFAVIRCRICAVPRPRSSW